MGIFSRRPKSEIAVAGFDIGQLSALMKDAQRMQPIVMGMIKIERHLQQHGGAFSMDFSRGEWTLGMQWGAEAKDSPMAAAAAYGVGANLDVAMIELIKDAHL